MTALQRILINTERWNETVVTPSLAKPHELICTPNIIKGFIDLYMNFHWICSIKCPMLLVFIFKLIYDRGR